MPFFDLDAAQLPHYRPDLRIPEDLASFWDATLREAREHPLGLEVRPIAGELTTVDVYDVEFAGFGGHRIKAWYLRPGHGVVPVVVEYLGYGGGRGLPHEHLRWACAGFGHLVMDTRGQGSAWGGGGGTPDPAGSGPAVPGVMTRGIESPRDHYYRRVYTDGVRAVEAARALPDVDPAAVAVTGVSQGGAITLAVAGLARGLVAAMPDVPFMCQVDRAITLTDSRPYCEVADYLHTHRGEGVEQRVLTTLSYVDAANIATMARVPALLHGPDGHHLPALHRVRGLQPLRAPRREPHRHLPLQPARGRGGVSLRRTGRLPARPPDAGRHEGRALGRGD